MYGWIGLVLEMIRQLFIIFLLSLYYYNELINSWTLNTKSFIICKTLLKVVSGCTILFPILTPSFLLAATVRTFAGFSQNSFEKRLVAACHFSKEFCANLRCYQPILGGNCTFLSSKEFCKFKWILR